MGFSVSQLVEPTIINYISSPERRFQSESLANLIRNQDEALFESIDQIDISEFAKNYESFYQNSSRDFSVEALLTDNVTSAERLELVSYKIFRQADVPSTSTGVDTDNMITASNLHDFLKKADFLLREISILVPDSEVSFDQFIYFATTLNEVHNEIDQDDVLNVKEFSDIVKSKLDSKRVGDFERVLDAVISIIENDEDKPVVFNAYI